MYSGPCDLFREAQRELSGTIFLKFTDEVLAATVSSFAAKVEVGLHPDVRLVISK